MPDAEPDAISVVYSLPDAQSMMSNALKANANTNGSKNKKLS